MNTPTLLQLEAAFTARDESGKTAFAGLSQAAQDAIVWAAMAGDGEEPPVLSEETREEIRRWAAHEES